MARKADFLRHPTVPISVGRKSVSELARQMARTGFQGRTLGQAVDVWEQMFRRKGMTIFLGLTGAMVPAGMRRVIAFLIERKLVDCIVSTGANLFHDAYEALGRKHYQGTDTVDDAALQRYHIDRMYDVYASEDEFRILDWKIAGFARSISPCRISTREFMRRWGRELARMGGARDSIVVAAYRNHVPLFVPAICDSGYGIALHLARRRGVDIDLDQLKDVEEIVELYGASRETGGIYVGGGVPRNFIQQTSVIEDIVEQNAPHQYGIQFTIDPPHYGGLSGSTFSEAVSWGKYHPRDAKMVQVFADATIALPIVAHALEERTRGLKRKRVRSPWPLD
ncbi:MAG: deoxyhypusine synthase [Halobacteria archaeon]